MTPDYMFFLFCAQEADRVLSFNAGAHGVLLRRGAAGWWGVKIGRRKGWVPAAYWTILEVSGGVGGAGRGEKGTGEGLVGLGWGGCPGRRGRTGLAGWCLVRGLKRGEVAWDRVGLAGLGWSGTNKREWVVLVRGRLWRRSSWVGWA